MFRVLTMCAALLLAGGCASPRPVLPGVAPGATGAAATPETAAAGGAAPAPGSGSEALDYLIQPSDVILVDVVGERDLERKELRVSSTGTINFPYLEGKEIEVVGLSTAGVAQKLRELLQKGHFVDPQIIVQVKEYKKRTVTVIGQVTKQGVVEFPSEQQLNVLEAIGYAGGFTQLANKGRITVIRRGQQYRFNLNDWLKHPTRHRGEQAKVFMLQPGDLVFVPETLL